MSCLCGSERIVEVMGHCVDRFTASMGNTEYGPDYVPSDLGIGDGDDIQFSYCLACGRIVSHDFPIHEDECQTFAPPEED
ncbi:hypothetical protein KAR91_28100 [Candidatus Pacearchaeota archaeon]|nr:hypothetical protein [Candidatus Pacearchaeota archaeon]